MDTQMISAIYSEFWLPSNYYEKASKYVVNK